MASRESAFIDITPEVLLKAYSCGIFPMAESAEDPALYWIEPERRGIIPLDRFHVPGPAGAHGAVHPISPCSSIAISTRSSTVAHSRARDGLEPGSIPASAIFTASSTSAAIAIPSKSMTATALVGGLYGVSLGRAFFGESMFHRARDASKIALVHLVARLKAGHYRLLDTQFVTEHLRTFGAVEVSRPVYHKLLDAALVGEGNFGALALDRPVSGATALARLATG